MKEKTKTSNTPNNIQHTCGDCGWGKFYYDFTNLDVKGNPICLECPFTTDRKRIRSERACDKWKAKRQENERSAK